MSKWWVKVISKIDIDLVENGSCMNKIVDCCCVLFYYLLNVGY